MTQLKPLTYDEHKAAEAAFRGYPPDLDWTESAKEIYVRLSSAIVRRGAGPLILDPEQDLQKTSR